MRITTPILAIAIGLIACGTPTDAPSSVGEAPGSISTPSSVSSPSASPAESPTSASSPEASSTNSPERRRYSEGDIIAVTGDGLAVRQGPGTAYPLLDAARWDEGGVQVLGSPYRLSAGDQLVIGQGPLAIDGRDWYEARHADDAILWTPPGDPGSGIHGWIAATDRDVEFVRLVEDFSATCCFVANGVGPTMTASVPTLSVSAPGARRGFTLTVGNPDPDGSCHVRVTDDTDQILLDQTIVGWGNPGAWWPGEGGRLVIETECAWSLSVGNSVA